MLQAARSFFSTRGYLEVETPCLSREIVLDAWLEPFEVRNGDERRFLQTSPEAFMKRLLAAGTGSIFQISRVFRKGESGTRHNPEFTMLEWYGAGSTWQEQMALTEQLVREVCAVAPAISEAAQMKAWSARPFGVVTYAEAFKKRFGLDVHGASGADLMESARLHGVPLPDSCVTGQVDDILNAMLAFGIEPALGCEDGKGTSTPVFLCDYPPTQAALAVTSDSDPKVARRFELYVDGLELCNGYQELTDPQELKRREQVQAASRQQGDLSALPGARRLAEAMSFGLPPCSGVALGFDRLVMIAAGASTIADVLPFSFERA
jgi:lysyl-tRNA synthetase class 2